MLSAHLTRAPRVTLAFALVLAACAGPTDTPGGSAAPSIDLPRAIAPAAIRPHLEALMGIATDNGGLRTAGTAGYEASVQYVAEQLREMGYSVETPEFEMATYLELPGGTVAVDAGPTFETGDDFKAMIYSASGDLSAVVTPIGFADNESGGCAATDFDGFVEGTIALAPPGSCFRRQVVLNAVAAGAVALVVSYPQYAQGEPRRPTLLSPDGMDIPVLSATGEVGEALQGAAEDGSQVHISVTTQIGQAMVHNVIAESHGIAERVVMLGGHLDGVHDGPGINDNGSGPAALLEIARVLAEERPWARVRFAFWGGEEFGLLGSSAYVDGLDADGRVEIAAYLNFDMLGSPNYVPIVYDEPGAAAGSAEIADFLVAYLGSIGISPERMDLGGGSDHYFFSEARIPTGGLFSGATEIKTDAQADAYGGTAGEAMDACYHLGCDTVERVNVDLVASFANAALAVTLAIAGGELELP
ncbi:MAG: M20/M25/M40 family metallo-hydrolase [Candidatus Limnocylindria bacterium]